jgi:hypothetical protein
VSRLRNIVASVRSHHTVSVHMPKNDQVIVMAMGCM